MLDVEVNEFNKLERNVEPYGLYKTRNGLYYWYFKTTQAYDCIWLSINPSTGERNTFMRSARTAAPEDVKVEGEVKLIFTLDNT